MAKRTVGRKDVYGNFFPLEATGAAAVTTLSHTNHNTSMGVDTNIGWRVHGIEWYYPKGGSTACRMKMSISTRKDLTVMPEIGDMGCVAQMMQTQNGGYSFQYPRSKEFMPPILLGAQNLTLYLQGDITDADYNGHIFRARILYTTVELSDDVYRELWQTWNYSN